MPLVKTTVHLADGDSAALRAMAKRSGKPQGQLIREAIQRFIRGGRRPLPASLGMFDSGRTDTSSTRKEILKEAALAGKWRPRRTAQTQALEMR